MSERMSRREVAWRKAIADQVRANCTPSSEAYSKGGDALVYAVADWIENPPEWSVFKEPVTSMGTLTLEVIYDPEGEK